MSFGIPLVDAVFWGIVTFSILVVLHEGGHFLAARAFHLKVHEFMVGLPGPAVRVRSKRSGTWFGVTMVPLGGYVRIAGMEPGREDELLAPALRIAVRSGRIDTLTLARALQVPAERASALLNTLVDWGALEAAVDDEYSYLALVEAIAGEQDTDLLARARAVTYRGLRTWQRIVMLSAGVVVNIVAAFLVLVIVIGFWGDPKPTMVVAETSMGAQAAGIVAGDRVLSVDGRDVPDFASLVKLVRGHKPGEVLSVAIERSGQRLEVRAEVRRTDDGKATPVLGIIPVIEYGPVPLVTALRDSAQLVGFVFVAVGSFFSPSTFPQAVQGARSVIGVSEELARAAKAGPLDYAWLVALLSLSLGAMNVLPIPPLDGGKIALELVERLIGRPVRREISLAFSAVGALLLFALIGYLMYADVARIARG